jgi:mannose-6-phosphate isomerase
MNLKPTGKIDKGWGFEVVWANTNEYCGKILCFKDTGSKMSMHFHKNKDETWFVNDGTFILRWIDTKDATVHEKILKEGDVWHNPPLQPHQLESLVPNGMIFEVSTRDSAEDNYRVLPGDSQIT